MLAKNTELSEADVKARYEHFAKNYPNGKIPREEFTNILQGAFKASHRISKINAQGFEDYIFEIGLTPNRCDAISHFGVARDLRAALSHRNETKNELILPSIVNFTNLRLAPSISVNIADSSLCHRFCGLIIKDVKIKPSPKKTYLNFRNSLYLLLKNLPKNRGFLIVERMIWDGMAFLFFILKFEFSNAFAIIKAHYSFYKNRSRIKEKISLNPLSINYYTETYLPIRYFLLKKKNL